MARPTLELINALRTTATRLANGADYSWSHQGMCNCGHLAQTITRKSRSELHSVALQKAGDWSEHALDYCPTSNLPIDMIISEMLRIGLSTDDLGELERLSAPSVLKRLPGGYRHLRHNRRADVILYLQTWAQCLEEQRTDAVDLTAILQPAENSSI